MSKPSSPGSPQSPKDAKSGGEKQTLDLGELMQRLDEAVAKTSEDSSELFVTNVKEQRSVLEDCRDYIDKLGRENATMAENFRRRDEEAFALQEVQTEEIAEKKARIEDLEAQLAQKVVDIEELHAHSKIEMQKITEERLKRRRMQVRFGARVEELHNRLESVKSFVRRQDEVEARMEAAEKETEQTRAQMADLAPGFECKYIEKCLAFKEVDKKPEEFMLKVKEDIDNRVSDRVEEVQAQNETLQSEIFMYASSVTGLQEEADRLKAENRRLSGDIDLKGQAEELLIKRSRHQRHVIRHDNKIQFLGKSLQQVIRQFCEERRILQEKHACLVAEFMADNMKAQEMKKFRHLAEIVIRQRGEVELFLLDSIQHVKDQIYMKKAIQSYHTAENADALPSNVSNVDCPSLDSSSTLVSTSPPIHKAPASWPCARPWPQLKHPEIHERNHNEGPTNDVITTQAQAEAQVNYLDSSHDPFTVPKILPTADISELSWDDREEVLRYLFKKINTARNNQLQAEPAKRTQAVQVEQAKYQEHATEAARTIV